MKGEKRIRNLYTSRFTFLIFLLLICSYYLTCSRKFNNPTAPGGGTGGNNHSPNPPTQPQPPDGAVKIDLNLTLGWFCTDPDLG